MAAGSTPATSAYPDEDGYLFIVDRKKDLVIRGGYNVYPREIEEVLYEHPAVAEAAVIGRPDAKLGEEVWPTSRSSPAPRRPRRADGLRQGAAAAYKYPREVRSWTRCRRGPTGKILKKELRA